ncbi:alpha/beta hydrolase [soil metagenome]
MYIRIDNRKIHFKRVGHGPAILFVHGWGGTVYSLHDVAQLATAKYTTYTIDLPGFGKSDNPPPHWGVEGYADLIALFLKKLNIKTPLYVGHSFGGAIGIYIASHNPELISSLVLCDSSFKRASKVSTVARIIKILPASVRPFFYPVEPIIKKVYYRLFQRNSDLMKYPHLEQNFRKIVTQDLTADTKKIHIPTLILWGEDDTATPVLWAYELEKNIAGSRLVVYPGVRHNLPLKRPDDVWGQIDAFSSEL